MTHRNAILPPPPRDTVECAPDLDDLAFDDEATSGVRDIIDPERAATMRAEWAALETVVSLPDFAVLDGEADPFATTYPGSLYR